VAAAGVALVGVFVERVAYRPSTRRAPSRGGVRPGGLHRPAERHHGDLGPPVPGLPRGAHPHVHLQIGNIHVTLLQILILFLSFALMGILYTIIQTTTFGAAVRATALDRDTASLMGINFNRIIFFIFTLGPALGAMAGVMVGMYYRQISFAMGWNYGLKAFTATILGGIGNLPGAMFGGLILGVLEMFGAAYISAAWKDVFVFLILILVLIFRPTGLFGEKWRRRSE
jgi:branched-chain amino acid transport system permease protein